MNKKVLIIVLVVLIGGAAVYALTANKKDTPAPATPPANTNQNQTTTNPPPAKTEPASATNVAITNFAFMPGDITVKKGTVVTWTNNDSAPHTVTETDSQTGPSSNELANGDKYSFTFDTAGTFHYKCSIHPYMLGTVTVTE